MQVQYKRLAEPTQKRLTALNQMVLRSGWLRRGEAILQAFQYGSTGGY